MVFRALLVLFSYGYNKETCKIIEATFLTLHFCPMRDFSQVKGGRVPVVNTLVVQSNHGEGIISTKPRMKTVYG